MIETNQLTKNYGAHPAVLNLDLHIHPGEWFLFLGPNGAGKTTTLRMLMGLCRPSHGTVRVAGFDPIEEGHRVRSITGYLADDFEPYDYLSGYEFLQFVADMHQIPRREQSARIGHVLDLLELEDASSRQTRDYSHGMKKKLGMAAALLHAPSVLILDEPTAELDPRTSKLIRMILRGLADQGAAIIMSTHILGATEQHCDRVGIIDKGTLVRCGTPDELVAEFPGASLEEVFLQLTGIADEEKIAAFLKNRSEPSGSQPQFP
jgi:ABC-2 type transport system ATP-binding protein